MVDTGLSFSKFIFRSLVMMSIRNFRLESSLVNYTSEVVLQTHRAS